MATVDATRNDQFINRVEPLINQVNRYDWVGFLMHWVEWKAIRHTVQVMG